MKRYITLLIFVAICLLAYTPLLYAENYYVEATGTDPDGAGPWGAGNDSNAGTSQSAPKKTLTSLVNAYNLTADDYVYMAGTFQEARVLFRESYNIVGDTTLGCTLNPTGANDGHFVRADLGTVTGSIRNCTILANTAVATHLFYTNQNGNSFTFEDCVFIVDNSMVKGVVRAEYNVKTTLVFNRCTFNVTNQSIGLYDYSIYIGGPTSGAGSVTRFNQCTFNFNVANNAAFRFAKNQSLISLKGCTINYNANPTHPMYFESTPAVDNMTCTGNTITASSPFTTGRVLLGGTAAFSSVTIEDNVINYNLCYGIQVCSSTPCSAAIRRNLIYHKGDDSSIIIGAETTNETYHGKVTALVENNVIYGPGYFNPASTTTDHGIGNLYQNVLARYNYVNGCGYGLVYKGDADSGHGTGTIFSNVLVNAVSGSGVILLKGADNCLVYNNTIYGDSQHTRTGVAGISLLLNDADANDVAVNNIIKNNAIYLPSSSGAYQIKIASGCTLSSDYNSFYGGAGANPVFSNGPKLTLAQWQALTGVDGKNLDTHSQSGANVVADNIPVPFAGSNVIGNGYDLGETYTTVLHPLTNWLDPDTVFYASQKTGSWNIGAYTFIGNDFYK